MYTNNYIDITNYVLKNTIPNNDIILEINKYKKYNTSNASFSKNDITNIERNTLKKVQQMIGGNFKLLHKVNINGVRTPDAEYINKLLHINKRYYDVKAPEKSVSMKSKSKKISRQLDSAKGQAKNVIISLLKKECDLTNKEADFQIIKCLNNRRYSWVNIIILVGKKNYIKIYKKK